MALSIMKTLFNPLFFTLVLQLQAFSQPVCRDSFPSSLLNNNSFEQYPGCTASPGLEGGFIDGPSAFGGISVNYWHSFRANTWEVHYINYDCRTNKLGSIFDTSAFLINQACSYRFPRVPRPLPDGNGFIAINENGIISSGNEEDIVKNYLTQCLSQPLYAGQTYQLTFSLGFGTKGLGECPMGTPSHSPNKFGVALYGRPDCPVYPLKDPELDGGCLTNNDGWVQLGQVTLEGDNEWVTGIIKFTPEVNIASIGIGPDCGNRSNRDARSMHYMDNLVLAPIADFSFKSITVTSGNACTGNYILKAPAFGAVAYQWYKDGVPVPGASSQTYTVPDKEEAAGTYVANLRMPYNTCFNTLPFTVKFSDLHKFNLGRDTALCAPATVGLNANWSTAIAYLWQDGSKRDTIAANNSGTYWVQLTDENGCTKKDSVTVIIQGCDECKLFIPSAFTPNNDGKNDLFRVKPKCLNIGLNGFKMRIYDRWGNLVFFSNNIYEGWDGRYKGKILAGTYVYLAEYSFKKDNPLQQRGTVVLLQ